MQQLEEHEVSGHSLMTTLIEAAETKDTSILVDALCYADKLLVPDDVRQGDFAEDTDSQAALRKKVEQLLQTTDSQADATFYLSDGGNSRIHANFRDGKPNIFLSYNATKPVKERWEDLND